MTLADQGYENEEVISQEPLSSIMVLSSISYHSLMAIRRVYIAGPMFCDAELQYNRLLKEGLSKHGIEAVLPQDLPLDIPDVSPGNRAAVNRVSLMVFAEDLGLLDSCDALVLNMDGRVPDEGACVELGYAYARGMPCFGIKTDVRTSERSMDNMMITGALGGRIARNIEELAAMISQHRTVPADDDLVHPDVLTRCFYRRLHYAHQCAAAGDLHPDDIHRCDVVLPEDIRDLIESGSFIELGASDYQRIPADEPLPVIVGGECGAVGTNN